MPPVYKVKKFFKWLDRKIVESRVNQDQLCKILNGAKLFPSARIFNILGKPENIVIGENSFIRGELLTFAHGGKISIGNYCYVGEGTRIWSAGSIEIGDRVLISHNVNIFDNDTHPIDDANARHKQFKEIIKTGHPKEIDLKERPVTICNDALIGCNSIILKGVTIGVGAVVGAGSVVCNDVAPFTIVAGNPARPVRTLKQDEI
jgi:acetyltransferase-like isoleucine patch superfamily enzyme